MAKGGNTKKKTRMNPLPIIAGAVVLIAALALILPRLIQQDAETVAVVSDGQDLVIQAAEINETASYFDCDVDGITVQVLAVRASDNTIRLALNTCQVCNGSPYAYFEQEGDVFICQNCKNRFASTDVGVVAGGCNPVPITAETYLEQNGTITVPADFLAENAVRFRNWKKF